MKRLSLRLLCLALALLLLTPLFAACGKKGGDNENDVEEEQQEELEENQIAVTWHPGAVCSDKMLSKAGQIDDTVEGYFYSDVITVDRKGTKLTFADEGETAGANYYVLSHWRQNDAGEWVPEDPGDHYAGGTGGRTAQYVATTADGVTTYTYITERNNESVRLCYNAGQTAESGRIKHAKVYLTKTTETPTLLLQKATKYYKDLRLGQYGFTEKKYPELAGKTIYIMGDSYFNDHVYGETSPSPYNLPALIAKKYGMTLANYAKSGSSVSAYVTTNNPMCRRITQMSAGSPDIVILEGGRNDLNIDAPLGTLYTGTGSERQLSLDETTFYGAVNSCIAQLKAKYPNAMIIGMTCWKVNRHSTGGVTQEQYADAMVRACAANGVPCIDAAHFSVVRMDDADFRAAYCRDATDISHMNIDGMILTGPTFEQALGTAYRAFIADGQGG